MTIGLLVNGTAHDVDAAPDTPLLYVLRNDLGLTGPKFGCGLGQCGACTVLVDGVAIRSCTTPVSSAARALIMTTAALLARNKQPTREQIRSSLNANLCRCGTHMRIVRAVEKAASLSLTQGTGGDDE